MHRLVLVIACFAAACGGDTSSPVDAGPCASSVPGIRVHLTFESGGTMSWSDGETPLHIMTSGGTGEYRVLHDAINAEWTGILSVAYPARTQVGAASASFYAIAGGLRNYEGGPVDFVGDPAACVDVDLPVRIVDPWGDAGIAEAATP